MFISSIERFSQFIGITLVLYLSDNCATNSCVSVESGFSEFNNIIKGLLSSCNSLTTRSSAFT